LSNITKGYVSRGLFFKDTNECVVIERFNTDREIANIEVISELRKLDIDKFTAEDDKPTKRFYLIFSCDALLDTNNKITQLTINIQWSRYIVDLSLIKRV
jgi:hypothetical protein